MKAQPQGWRWKATLLFTLVLCSMRGAMASTPANLDEKHSFDIAPGAAAPRLTDFCIQSGVDLIYGVETVNGATVAGVQGEYSPLEALDKMLAGTGIRFKVSKRHNVTLTRAPPARMARTLSGKRDASRRNKGDRRTPDDALEEVTISGTQESEIAETGSPIFAVTRADIDASGFATAQAVVRTLPQVFGGGPTEDTFVGTEARTNVMRGSGINLRGLGAASTLILINGERVPGGGTDGIFADISNLPLAAIERIDVLPDSSSTLYGSDAVGGVVNFVMRDNFKGRQTEAYFGDSTRGGGFNENYLSQLFGLHTESGHGLLAVDFYSRANLPAADREMARSDLTEYGGSNFDIPQSNPGNIVYGGSTWAIPHDQNGTGLKPGDFTKDAPNLQDRYKGGDLLPSQQRWTVFGTWRQDLSDRLSFFTDALVGQRDIRGFSSGYPGTLQIPVTNAFYASPVALPTRVPLLAYYNFYDDLGPQLQDARVNSRDVSGGLELRLGRDWRATGTVGYGSEDMSSLVVNQVNQTALTAALASSDPLTAFNPFGDGSNTNPVTLDAIRGFTLARYRSNISSGALRVSGPLATLPGGDAMLSFGSDARKQEFRSTLQTNASTTPTDSRVDRERSIHSEFAELQVPLVGPSNRIFGVDALTFSVAERYEHYSDFGKSAATRLGLSWAPVRGLTVRGSYSESFRPPGLLDLDESTNAYLYYSQLIDPSTGKPANVLLWAGKNEDLKEETAHSWTAGLELEPESLPNAAVALTYFSTDFTNRLSQPGLSADLLSNPALSPLVTRNPSADLRSEVCSRAPVSGVGPISCMALPITAIVDLRYRNDAVTRTRGFDMLARYELATTRAGRFNFALNGTYITRFAEAKAAYQPLVDEVSTQNHPLNLKMRGVVRWRLGAFDLSGSVNYYNHYEDLASTPHRSVASWTTTDLRAAYTVNRQDFTWLGDTTFALGVDNLFDRDPPFLNNLAGGIGYDQENGDLTGRMVSFTVRKNW